MSHLKRFESFQNEEEKNELFSTYHITHFSNTKTSILACLKYVIIFLRSWLSNEMQHLKVG